MKREEALAYLQQHLKNDHLIKHSLAVESIMRGLARHLGEDETEWGLTGLLHDIDYESTADDPNRHSLVGAEMLTDAGFPSGVVYAVKVHNEAHNLPRISQLDKALFAADPTSGFITAAALVRPEKQLAFVEVKSLKKRFKEKSFAKGANRDNMASCTELGLELEEFLALSLAAMQQDAEQLGL
ncbi:MAG: HDIG domain-containing metalloprotein [Methylocystaceae bacterium]